MRRTPLLTTLAFLTAVFIIPATALAQRRTEVVDRTLPMSATGTLRLNNFSGDVRITAGSSNQFVMKATRTGREDRLRDVRLEVETSGSTISVEANRRDDSRRWRDNENEDGIIHTVFEIQVPAGASLDINTFSSDVIIEGITGHQRLKTFSGDIRSSASKAAVEGETFSGDIEVDATGQSTSPDLSLETFSGTIRVRLVENAKGTIEFNTFNGSIDTNFALTLNSSSRRNTRATLPGGAGRTLRFKSFSGSLRLTR